MRQSVSHHDLIVAFGSLHVLFLILLFSFPNHKIKRCEDCISVILNFDVSGFSSAIEERYKIVCDLNDSLESVSAAEYPAFLAAYLRPLCALLKTVPPQFSERSEHKLRHKVNNRTKLSA
jgi:hypothetical protein